MSRRVSSPERGGKRRFSVSRTNARLLLVPALATLLLTLLQLTADLLRWTTYDPPEIAWLAPVFGAYFGVALGRTAHTPTPSRLLSSAIVPAGLLVLAISLFRPTSGATVVVSLVAVLLVRRVWPRLNDLLLAYALAARAPIAVMMLFATRGRWETVYDVSPFSVAAGLLPQLTAWFAITVVTGTVAAGASLSIREWHQRRNLRDSAAAS